MSNGAGEESFYAEMRRHITALPPDVVKDIRVNALYAYRSLENMHPAEPDRVRAVLLVSGDMPSAAVVADRPAGELIMQQGQSNADEIERKLTRMLLA